MKILRITASLALALAVASCAGTNATDATGARADGTSPAGSTSASGTHTHPGGVVHTKTHTVVAPATGTADAAMTSVEVKTFKFTPEAVTIKAGSTVEWVNGDNVRHTVTAGTPDAPEADKFDLELAPGNGTAKHTFTEPGTYVYFCGPHHFMTGTITVTA